MARQLTKEEREARNAKILALWDNGKGLAQTVIAERMRMTVGAVHTICAAHRRASAKLHGFAPQPPVAEDDP